MKYIITWPYDNTYGDERLSETAGTKEDVSKVIENWLAEDTSLTVDDFTVYELGNELSLEHKVIVKEVSSIKVK